MDAASCPACEGGLISTPFCPYCGAPQKALSQPVSTYPVAEDASHAWVHFAEAILREYPPGRIGPRRKARREIALALARHYATRGARGDLASVHEIVDEVREKTIQFRNIMERAEKRYIPFAGNFYADDGWEHPTDYGTAQPGMRVSDDVEEYGSD